MSFFLVLSPTTTAQALVQQPPCWQPPAPHLSKPGSQSERTLGAGTKGMPRAGVFPVAGEGQRCWIANSYYQGPAPPVRVGAGYLGRRPRQDKTPRGGGLAGRGVSQNL